MQRQSMQFILWQICINKSVMIGNCSPQFIELQGNKQKNEIGRQRIVFMRIPITCDYNSTRCKQVQREFNYFLSSSNGGLGTLYSHARIYFECSNPSLIERSLLILDAWRNNYFGFIVRRMMALLTTQTTSPSIFVNTLAMMKFHIAFSCLTILTRPVAESAV
jgi:hypothetical protein